MNNDKELLLKAAKEAFDYHKEVDEVLVVSDGNVFLPAAKNLAHDHARRISGKVNTITRKEAETGKLNDSDSKEEGDELPDSNPARLKAEEEAKKKAEAKAKKAAETKAKKAAEAKAKKEADAKKKAEAKAKAEAKK